VVCWAAGVVAGTARQPAHNPKISSVWLTSAKPCSSAMRSAHRSTAGPATSTVRPQPRQTRWWWCCGLQVERLAAVGAQGVELAVVGQRLDGAVDRRQPDLVARVAQPRVHLLRAVEAVEVLEDRSDGSALSGGPGHAAMVSGRHGTVCDDDRRRENTCSR
jgi:hypothetical protein